MSIAISFLIIITLDTHGTVLVKRYVPESADDTFHQIFSLLILLLCFYFQYSHYVLHPHSILFILTLFLTI